MAYKLHIRKILSNDNGTEVEDDMVWDTDIKSMRRWRPTKQEMIDLGDPAITMLYFYNGSNCRILEDFDDFKERMGCVPISSQDPTD